MQKITLCTWCEVRNFAWQPE